MQLIIVESPTKAKTIAKFLGSAYRVESSFGHIRDLSRSKMGIDLENNFKPKYVVPEKSKKKVAELKKLAEKSELVVLAPDEDREGEAIAWHLLEALSLDEKKTKRIVFHEITKEAIRHALDNPRDIDYKMVDAQQARRILDRLVGYQLSPFLWKKVARGLSAGRVQSVALRLIVEREREIKAFKEEEYWSLEAILFKKQESFSSLLNKVEGKKIDKFYFKSEEDIKKIIPSLEKGEWIVEKIESKEVTKNPLPPFTTSTLQQTANRKLGFSAKQTMMIAQKLYEKGHITYMRTDSFNLASKFKKEAEDYLGKNLGDKYNIPSGRSFKTKKKGAQEAHEAIRPTSAFSDPEKISNKLDDRQLRLYRLIWQRALASQMTGAVLDTLSVDISAGEKKEFNFKSNGQTIKFKGYLEIYPEKLSENDLPVLESKDKLDLDKIEKHQHFTQPPARYSDASLVKALEKHEIGRPSTYAPTIATILDRNYVNRDDNKKLFPTDIAFIVNDLLVNHFSSIVDFKFTAEIENDLDEISLGKKEWQTVIKDFWEPFYSNLEKKYKELDKKDISPEEESDEICEKCGAKMIVKTGRYGKFLACSSYPECRNIKSMDKEKKEDSDEIKELKEKYKDEKCEKCGSEMIVRVGKFGPFLGCSAYPKCKNIVNIGSDDIDITCPLCKKGKIVKKFSRRGVFYACNAYPDCKNAYFGKPTGDKCAKCGALMIEDKNKNIRCSNKECYKEKKESKKNKEK
jgi:DNA topoisomerase I